MKKRTFVDSGVLLTAFSGVEREAEEAFKILEDPNREFVSSIFVQMELLPKAIYNRNEKKIVIVHREVERREGRARPRRYALIASTRWGNGLFPWSRHVLVTVMSLAVRSSPSGDWFPKQIFRHWTAGRMPRSATLLVGSTPSYTRKVNRWSQYLIEPRDIRAASRSDESS